MKKSKKLEPIKIKKLNIRGDEIAILFFSLLFLIFLFISFFRLFAVGKLFDDFIFLFLFGWSKYLVYITLFSLTVPICFNYYFKIKFSFILAMSFSLLAISWFVSNINLIVTSSTKIWLSFRPYNFTSFSNYFNEWWSSTIINNYHGFFAQPISFDDWTNINSFFPGFAPGGVISNLLVVITNYGTFVTNLLLNFLFLIISFSWLFFNKPWFFFTMIFFFAKPLISYFQKQKVKKMSQKSLKQEQVALKDSAKITATQMQKPTEVKVKEIKSETIIKNSSHSELKQDKQQLLIQNVLKESGNLTPFGQVQKDPTQKIEIIANEPEQEINS